MRLRPAPHCRTRILSLLAAGRAGEALHQLAAGPAGELPRAAGFPEKTDEFRIEVDLVAEMAVLNPFDFFLEPYAEKFPFAYEACDKRELAPYLVMRR